MTSPQCPQVLRWWLTKGTRVDAISEVIHAAKEAGFATEPDPSRACFGVHGSCSYSSERGGPRLWVWVDDQRHDIVERDDDEVVVELQLSPTF